MRLEDEFELAVDQVIIRIIIDLSMENNSFLYREGQFELFFPFYKIADHVSGKYVGIVKRKKCMCKEIHENIILLISQQPWPPG